MNIKVVSEKTGLTKKAIKYYEAEGLINPSKNNENQYREYTADDLIKLNLIGALRMVGIPVNEIKALLLGDEALTSLLQGTLRKIKETICDLEKTSLIISNILTREEQDYQSIGEQVRRLRETLELSMAEKNELLANRLLRIFPGNFGRIFVAAYQPFLKITIDSSEKQAAWLRLVEYLDELDEVNGNHPWIKGMNQMEISKFEAAQSRAESEQLSLLSGDPLIKEKHKKFLLDLVRSINQSAELRKTVAQSITKTENLLLELGAAENCFDSSLEILNEDYRKYREIGREIRQEVDQQLQQEFGFTMEEFWSSLKDN